MRPAHPSPTQVRNRLILAARYIVAEHRPTVDGSCPVCRFAGCQALLTAQAYLDSVGAPPARGADIRLR
ncbi:hypothetical protein O7627_03300 [Solwaraspora sp. WMMD1047]|uniref:hypothetical protein n=1 Tax=Solwaraspora sp. WMMD1047 TaxID=3016102 RepID=UPI00241603B2|nr:hypothetical protein [Solwaraspora sp. WMMD1047]MDG4828330.1 hypothetical protein [Solwaraspora sp. WMMD1047]